MKASEIAEFLGSELIGEDIEITGVCSFENPKDNHLAFWKFNEQPLTPNLNILILIKPGVSCYTVSYIEVDNPRLAHARVVEEFFAEPHTVIPNGDGYMGRHPWPGFVGAHIYDCVEIGMGCFFKPGAVIGGSGFGWENDEDGVPIRRPHVGGVVIGNNVEIGSNSVVNRGTIDDTILEDNVKIDDLVHIAHNVHIGKNTCIASGSVVGGSATIGRDCWLGTQCVIKNQATIGNNVTIGIGAVVVKDVPDGAVLAGFKAQPIEIMRAMAQNLETDVSS